MLGFFSFILDSTANWGKNHLDVKILIINTNNIITLFIIYICIKSVHK